MHCVVDAGKWRHKLCLIWGGRVVAQRKGNSEASSRALRGVWIHEGDLCRGRHWRLRRDADGDGLGIYTGGTQDVPNVRQSASYRVDSVEEVTITAIEHSGRRWQGLNSVDTFQRVEHMRIASQGVTTRRSGNGRRRPQMVRGALAVRHAGLLEGCVESNPACFIRGSSAEDSKAEE
jgi:hypothetical protein